MNRNGKSPLALVRFASPVRTRQGGIRARQHQGKGALRRDNFIQTPRRMKSKIFRMLKYGKRIAIYQQRRQRRNLKARRTRRRSNPLTPYSVPPKTGTKTIKKRNENKLYEATAKWEKHILKAYRPH